MTDLTFGDDEPEDAWCPTDDTDVLLDDLRRRAALLERGRGGVPESGEPGGVLDALQRIVDAARRRRLTGHDLERAKELADDIAFLRGRV